MKLISKYALVAAGIFMTVTPFASATAKLPAEKVIAAIQMAVARFPGQIVEVEVDQEFGHSIVEVKIENDKGNLEKVKVNVDKNEVVN